MAHDNRKELGATREGSVLLSASEAAQAAHLLKILQSADRAREPASPVKSGGEPAVASVEMADMARRFFAARKARHAFFRPGMFREYAWDMLLALYARASETQSSHVVEITKLAGASHATGLSYLRMLEEAGLIERKASATDQRMVQVQLTGEGFKVMDSYFQYLVETGLEPSPSRSGDTTS